MIAIINYGLGNVQAFANVYKRQNIPTRIVNDVAGLEGASKLILPGVGAFDHAMKLLNGSGMREKLDELVLEKSLPVLGVCVGMQIMARDSEEGEMPGLAWVDGTVRRLPAGESTNVIMLPHMGWNDVGPASASPLFGGLESEARFYFLHSFCIYCDHPANVLATSDYGTRFACSVQENNVYGVQFHPEKSHQFGVRLLQNFAEI